jgi:DNA-directed RNA polymerase specialized sigma24 family protein
VLEARERLAQLKPDERTALLLFGLGYSYHEIGERRGWSYTKVNRAITEGRAALRRGQHAG